MNDNRADVRYRVAGSYGRMLSKEQRPCCGIPTSARGYEQAEVTALPTDTLVNALGCGSPVTSSHLDPGDVVLDLGCGAGIDLLLAASKVGPAGRVIGVDMAGAMIRRARSSIAAAGIDNVEVHPGTIEDLPIADGSVDWVISNCVINLSPEKPRVFTEVARVLKAGGGMRVVDIVAETVPEWVRHNDMLFDSCIAGAIGEMDYVAGLRDAGLTDIALGGRYVYDRDQLVALGAGALASSADADRLANVLVGRVWSVYISARKPLQRTPPRHREV